MRTVTIQDGMLGVTTTRPAGQKDHTVFWFEITKDKDFIILTPVS